MIVSYSLILVMTLTASFASFFLKKSANCMTIFDIVKSKYLYAGGFLYLIAAMLNILLLKRMAYSIVVPLGSICYVWTMFIARMFLNERIRIEKIIGILLIISGVVFVTRP